ncbi:hypothetical protein D9611_000687 [Ephemerocybe angulata]|uniref:F-box domain-containing protein n=1 Tax=Ephemerocybe angulata TaxID=980116 RepID=A0A8H5F6V2_9AGAR|nr:hypothetical protein D9611_000687 [Tulosesus angulatus]
MSATPTVLDIPDEINLRIIKLLPVMDLQAFAQASRQRALARTALDDRFKDLLRLWGLDVAGTVTMMRDTQTVLGGSGALAVVLPDRSWFPLNLDFYCPLGRAHEVVAFFRTQSYYNMRGAGGYVPPYANKGVNITYTLASSVVLRGLSVVESLSSSSPLVPILFFDCTLGMNYVSSTGVTCCFPVLAKGGKGLLFSSRYDDSFRREQSLSKYREVGFSLQESCRCEHHDGNRSPQCRSSSPRHCLQVLRRTSDKFCLRLSFTDNVCVSPGPEVSWRGTSDRSSTLVAVHGKKELEVFVAEGRVGSGSKWVADRGSLPPSLRQSFLEAQELRALALVASLPPQMTPDTSPLFRREFANVFADLAPLYNAVRLSGDRSAMDAFTFNVDVLLDRLSSFVPWLRDTPQGATILWRHLYSVARAERLHALGLRPQRSSPAPFFRSSSTPGDPRLRGFPLDLPKIVPLEFAAISWSARPTVKEEEAHVFASYMLLFTMKTLAAV